MVLIEALKEQKYILRKMEDLRKKITLHCADLDCMQPTYGTAENQRKEIAGWIQAHNDLAFQLTKLKKSILRTNLETRVTIKIGEQNIEHSISEWVIRKREVIDFQLLAYNALNDRGLSQQSLRTIGGADEANKMRIARVRFYFDASNRDEQIELLKKEKEDIDKTLEIVNATTMLME